MAYFEWASDMVIDHDGLIDYTTAAWSRRLFARCHQPRQWPRNRGWVVEELLADTKEHLAHEERFMASVRLS